MGVETFGFLIGVGHWGSGGKPGVSGPGGTTGWGMIFGPGKGDGDGTVGSGFRSGTLVVGSG